MIPFTENSREGGLIYTNRKKWREEEWMTKEHKEACGGGESVLHLGRAGGFMRTRVCQNSSRCTLSRVPITACLLYLNTAVRKNER